MQKDLKTIFGNADGLDEKSIRSLTNALAKNNLPGFDYLEYKQSLGALVQMNMDEETAFKSAFATASTMGLTKDKLVKTAGHYKNVLMNEKKQFDQALQKQMDQRVKSKKAETEKLKKQIDEYKVKVKQLLEKIEKSQATIDSADEHIKAAVQKIEATQQNFEKALESIFSQINTDLENIDRYL